MRVKTKKYDYNLPRVAIHQKLLNDKKHDKLRHRKSI